MKLSERDRKALIGLLAAVCLVLILRYTVLSDAAPSQSADADSIAQAEQRVSRLRQLAALVPARATVVRQADADLADRERGLLQADTAAQAQAALLEVARRVGKGDQMDIRGGDFPAPKTMGDYGLVYATITFECRIEQLVNFLADLSHQQELVVPSEERITSGQAKQKTVNVRMVLAGVVPKKLVPEKKGLGAF